MTTENNDLEDIITRKGYPHILLDLKLCMENLKQTFMMLMAQVFH